MQLPKTIQECLVKCRNPPTPFDIEHEDEAISLRQMYDRQTTDLCAPRLEEIVDIFRGLSEGTCANVSCGKQILAYIKVCDTVKPWQVQLKYSWIHGGARDGGPEEVDFTYQPGLYQQYRDCTNFERITVPTAWLVCQSKDLKEIVLSDIQKELRQRIDEKCEELEELLNAIQTIINEFAAKLLNGCKKSEFTGVLPHDRQL